MSEYFDLAALDDVDPFARELGPLATLEQDIQHMLLDPPGSHIMDPGWPIGLEDYLGKPLPSNLASTIEGRLERDDRVQAATVRIRPLDDDGDAFEVAWEVQATEGFVRGAIVIAARRNELPPTAPESP